MKKLFIISILSVLIFDGCKKKFPERPIISFQSVDKRVSNLWTLQNYIVDGIDSAEIINSILGAKCKIQFHCFCSHGDAAYKIQWGNDTSNYYQFNYDYLYNTIGGDLGISLYCGHQPDGIAGHIPQSQFVVFQDTASTARNYQILRCKQNELWLKTISHGRTYELHLE